MEDKDRERLREVERQYELLKERLIDINLGVNHIKGMYEDMDDRGNEHARRIEEVRRNTENILRQLEQHHEALFKPPGSIYFELEKLKDWRERVEKQTDKKLPLVVSVMAIAITVLNFLIEHVLSK